MMINLIIRKLSLLCILACIGFGLPVFAQSDQGDQQTGIMGDTSIPPRWMTMEQVENRYGTPLTRSQPVGEPPISWWEYDRYEVYFERNRVLHTVMKR